jgi:hypothetical protein
MFSSSRAQGDSILRNDNANAREVRRIERGVVEHEVMVADVAERRVRRRADGAFPHRRTLYGEDDAGPDAPSIWATNASGGAWRHSASAVPISPPPILR